MFLSSRLAVVQYACSRKLKKKMKILWKLKNWKENREKEIKKNSRSILISSETMFVFARISNVSTARETKKQPIYAEKEIGINSYHEQEADLSVARTIGNSQLYPIKC